MELIKITIQDFVLFSLIEGFIFCLFFNKIGGFERFKLKEIIFISVVNCIITVIALPIFMQLFSMLFMSYYLYRVKNSVIMQYNLKITACSIMYFILIEMSYFLFLEHLFFTKLNTLYGIELFLILIPIRIIEILILLKGGNTMKIVVGSGVKR